MPARKNSPVPHMNAQQKRSFMTAVWQFIKLNLAGNVLFWGTMIGSFVFYELLSWPQMVALAVASVIAHIGFFIIDKEWVFADKHSNTRKTRAQFIRFALFMGFNYFLNLGIIAFVMQVTPLNLYLAQVVSGLVLAVWNFIGLKWWVFYVKKPKARRASRAKSTRRRSRVTAKA